MGRSAREGINQDRCINYIVGLGLTCFVVCLFPLAFDLPEKSQNLPALLPHCITRVAIVAAMLPLLWDYAYDLALPQRLTYPRTILLVAMLFPNVIVLFVSDPSLESSPVRLSVCFAFASGQLFNCGLLAYIAGEASSKNLLIVLALIASWGCLWNIFFIVKVFVHAVFSTAVLALTLTATSVMFLVVLVWYVRDMKTLDERRRTFAMIYTVAIGAYAILKHICYIGFNLLHVEAYVQDAFLCIEVLTATGISAITSRMAQHDATIAMVRAGQCNAQMGHSHCYDECVYLHCPQNMLQSKKNFVRYVSHEIRTPLNTVFMGIQLARTQLAAGNADDSGSILHDVEESCVTAVEILNDILLYDKIEDGRMELEKSDVSAKRLVKSVADLFMVQVGQLHVD